MNSFEEDLQDTLNDYRFQPDPQVNLTHQVISTRTVMFAPNDVYST